MEYAHLRGEELITLSNGFSFSTLAASGSMGFDGKGYWWVPVLTQLGLVDLAPLQVRVAKTVTIQRKKGNWHWYNPLYCYRPLTEGSVNAVALSNPGFDWFLGILGQALANDDITLLPSISGSICELAYMTKALSQFDLKAIVINLSCPNIPIPTRADEIIAKLFAAKEQAPNIPLLVKLSVTHEELLSSILPKMVGAIEGIKINSVPWAMVFPKKESPLRILGGGGVSGKLAQAVTRPFIKRITHLSNIPVIAPNIWDMDDIALSFELGAKAVSFGSVLTPPHIFRAAKILREI